MISLDREKFLSAINSKWKSKKCPMCGHNHWNIDSNLVSPLKIRNKGGVELSGHVMPLVAVTCMYCGNVIFVNPIAIGALINITEEK